MLTINKRWLGFQVAIVACCFWVNHAQAAKAPGVGRVGQATAVSSLCSSCGSTRGEGGYGVYVAIGTGRAALGGSAGELIISATRPGPLLSTPSALTFSGNTNSANDVMVVRDLTYGFIRQVRTPQAFVTVTTNSQFSYQINVYSTNAQGATDIDGTFLVVNPASNLIKTWTISNPDGQNSTNRLEIDETPAGGSMDTWMYTYNLSTLSWALLMPGSLCEQRINQKYDSGTKLLSVDVQWAPPGETAVSERCRKYYSFSWGRALVSETVGTGADARTTTNYYYQDSETNYAATASRPPLKWVVRPDGSWNYYVYDSNGRVATNFAGIDTAMSVPPVASTCRMVVYDYTPVDGADYGTAPSKANWSVARTETVYVKGTAVSKTFRVFTTGQDKVIQCTSPTAQYADSSSKLTSTTTYYVGGANDGRVQNTLRPDGTMTLYNYSVITNADGSQETDTVFVGQPSGGNIIDGLKTVTVLGNVGQILSQTTTDIASGALVSSDIYTYLDADQRSYKVTKLGGVSQTVYYACCGIDNMTDHDGVFTQYLYDNAHRPIGYIKDNVQHTNPIAYTNALDGAGRVIRSVRIGSDGSTTTLGQSSYNTAGEVATTTNGLNGVTSYAKAMDPVGGGVITTATNPDLSTRITTNNIDGTVKSIGGTGVHGVSYTYGVNADGTTYVQETKLLSNGSFSSEWTKATSDCLGRSVKTEYAAATTPYPSSQSYFNAFGQLWKTVDPDGVVTLFSYDGKGQQTTVAVAMSSNDAIDYNNDRITYTIGDVCVDHGFNVRRTRVYSWDTFNSSGSILVSCSEISTDGLRTWLTSYTDGVKPSLTISVTVPGSLKIVSITNSDNSYTISTYNYGRLTSVNRFSSSGDAFGAVTYGYDPHGRQSSVTDARNGITVYTYNDADLVESVTTPDPQISGGSPETTTTYYNKMLQATSIVSVDGVVANLYHQTGELLQTSGSRTYPVSYGYDYAGRMKYMTNWSGFATLMGARVTSWNYDAYRGWLWSKDYPDSITGNPPATAGTAGPVYTNTPGGRLKTRRWLRGTLTTYGYGFEGPPGGKHGDLVSITYANEPNGVQTPAVTKTYDRRGRVSTVGCNGTTTTVAYDGASELLSESYSGGGTLNGVSVVNVYDPVNLRRNSLTLKYTTTTLDSWSYGYDNASRLQTVSEGVNKATYGYLANSPLVQNIVFANNGQSRMTTVKSYDKLNRLWSISATPTASGALADTYAYNSANQRIRNTLADGSYWTYQYDAKGQVTSGRRYWSDNTPVEGQQFVYVQDDIGNRTSTQSGGDQSGGNLRPAAGYRANALNQYDNRDVPGFVDVMGAANASATVTVNDQATSRKGEYFRKELAVNNANAPVYYGVTNIGAISSGNYVDIVTNLTGNIYIPKAMEQFVYDLDGNLTGDGRWTYVWDGENRLLTMTAKTTVGPQQLIKFEYDYQGRRIHKQVWNNTVGTGSPAVDQRFIYDGWNLIAVLNPSFQLTSSFAWGLDLSGSVQGAGGVGGLLWVYDTTIMGQPSTHFVAFDGNGNLSGLVHATYGTNTATYEYGPFGELIRATGPMATNNPFRFSTKYTDNESDLVYYGYRYYNPSTGRWINRDPIQEKGGVNLYCFVNNNGIVFTDSLGLLTDLFIWVDNSALPDSYNKAIFERYINTVQSTADMMGKDLKISVVYQAMPGGWSTGWQRPSWYQRWFTHCYIDVYSIEVKVQNFDSGVMPGAFSGATDNLGGGNTVGAWNSSTGIAYAFYDRISKDLIREQDAHLFTSIVMAHELFHGLGAKHIDCTGCVMNSNLQAKWADPQNPLPVLDVENLHRIFKTLNLE